MTYTAQPSYSRASTSYRVVPYTAEAQRMSTAKSMRGLGQATTCPPGQMWREGNRTVGPGGCFPSVFAPVRTQTAIPTGLPGSPAPCPPGQVWMGGTTCRPMTETESTALVAHQEREARGLFALQAYVYGGAAAPFVLGGLAGWKTKSIKVGVGVGAAVALAEFIFLRSLGGFL